MKEQRYKGAPAVAPTHETIYAEWWNEIAPPLEVISATPWLPSVMRNLDSITNPRLPLFSELYSLLGTDSRVKGML